MKVGVIKEIKQDESTGAITPAGVRNSSSTATR